MLAAVFAAIPALEMIGGGEHDAAQFIVVEVRGGGVRGGLFTNQCEDLRRVI